MSSKKSLLITGRWTAKEQELFNAVIASGDKSWREVSELIGTRTQEQCRSHYQKCRIGVRVKKFNSQVQKSRLSRIETKEKESQCPNQNIPFFFQTDTSLSTDFTPTLKSVSFSPERSFSEPNSDLECDNWLEDSESFLKF